jgi:LCP family protein required for cell wall assembly
MPSGDDVVTVLLLGSDTITPGAAARTDVIIVVSIDRTAGSVSMLHIPRDMLVYIPNSEKGMDKINTVVNYGNQRYGPGGGAKLIEQTLLYNYGLKIDFYARVDFVNFQEIIKELGGLQISVDCAVEGNKLKSPDLDITKPENYEPYTINIGVHKLDPYTALWYVRARGSSSDLDRGRRQIEVLRAIWRQAKGAGLLAQVTGLWPQVQKIVETDMTLTDIVGLVPVALSLDPASVQQVVLTQNVHFTQWYTSDVGSFAWLPVPAAWQTAVQNFVLPPSRSRLGGENPTVDVGAALPLKGYDQTAADRLSWEGYNVRLLKTESVVNRAETVIYDYTGGAKPNSLEAMRKALRVSPGNVISQPDPNATADFRVEMGRDYGTSCFYGLQN